MPYLRFSRDSRGYENTYVLHTSKKIGETQPRMLYWFRTPPNVKVGRVPLDEESIRAVEEMNPGIVFDWKKMLKLRATLQADQRFEASSRRSKKRRRPASAKIPVEATQPEASSVDVEAVADVPASGPSLANIGEEEISDLDVLAAEAHLEPDDAEKVLDEPSEHPVVTLLGEETLVRLRATYAEIRTRIDEKVFDPAVVSEMLTRAEAIDPDRWNTTESAVRGIERFESKAEAIRADLGRRPPRPRPVEQSTS